MSNKYIIKPSFSLRILKKYPLAMKIIKSLLTKLFFGLFLINSVFAAKIYITDYAGEANAKVFITKYKGESNCIVFETDYASDNDPGVWYFTKYKGEARASIYYTQYQGEADLLVYFTKYKSEARCRF